MCGRRYVTARLTATASTAVSSAAVPSAAVSTMSTATVSAAGARMCRRRGNNNERGNGDTQRGFRDSHGRHSDLGIDRLSIALLGALESVCSNTESHR